MPCTATFFASSSIPLKCFRGLIGLSSTSVMSSVASSIDGWGAVPFFVSVVWVVMVVSPSNRFVYRFIIEVAGICKRRIPWVAGGRCSRGARADRRRFPAGRGGRARRRRLPTRSMPLRPTASSRRVELVVLLFLLAVGGVVGLRREVLERLRVEIKELGRRARARLPFREIARPVSRLESELRVAVLPVQIYRELARCRMGAFERRRDAREHFEDRDAQVSVFFFGCAGVRIRHTPFITFSAYQRSRATRTLMKHLPRSHSMRGRYSLSPVFSTCASTFLNHAASSST